MAVAGLGQASLADEQVEYGAAPAWVKPVEAPAASGQQDGMPLRVALINQQVRLSTTEQEIYTDSILQVQTPQGLQAVSTLSLQWKPDTDTLTVHRLTVRRGGELIDLLADGTKFTPIRREQNLEFSALDGVLTAVLQPPDLRVGDSIELAYSLRRSDPVLAGSAETVAGGWVQAPMARVHFSAQWAKSSGIRWRATDDLKPSEQHADDATELVYQADNLSPPLQPTGAPMRFAVTRLIELTSFGSWADVSRRLAPLYVRTARLKADSPLHQEVERIRKSASDPAARASAALQLVEDSVRYVFLGMNEGGLVPAEADVTWSRRFGDCKAKTVLLVALLRELGIDAEPVAVSTRMGDGLDQRLPMIASFDHVLVRAHLGARAYWLDATRSGDTRIERLNTPNYHWGLPLLESGSELVPMVPEPLAEPTSETGVSIDARAGIYAPAPFRAVTTYRGDTALATRAQLATLSGDSLHETLRKFWSERYRFVDVKSVEAKYDSERAVEILSMDGTANLEWSGGRYETDDLQLGYQANFSRAVGSNQSAPYAVAFPRYERYTEKILLPRQQMAFTIEGGDVNRTLAGTEYRRTLRFDAQDSSFYGEASSRSVRPEFPASEATEAQKELRALAKATVYLRSPDDYSDTDADLDADVARKFDSASEYIDLGNRLMDRDRNKEAVAAYDQAIALDPKSGTAFADRGMARMWLNQNDLATADWKAATALAPDNSGVNAIVLRGRGVMAVRQRQFTDAIDDLGGALKAEPHNRFALWWRAYAYYGARRWQELVDDTSEYLQLEQNVTMLVMRGNAHAMLRDAEAAKADAIAVFKLAGSPPAGASMVRAVYAHTPLEGEAPAVYDEATRGRSDARVRLGRAYVHARVDRAARLAEVEAALALDPHDVQALPLRAELLLGLGQYAAAVEASSAALKVQRDSQVYLLRSAAYARLGKTGPAQEDLESAKQLYGTQGNALNELCWTLAIHDYALDEALQACKAATAASPDAAAFLDSLGMVYLRMGKFADAIASYDAALQHSPGLPASLYGRGLAKLRTGGADAARQDMDAAADLSPDIAEQFASYGLAP